jgi:hypothetical protein
MRSTPEVPRETVNGSSIAIAPRKQIGSDGALVRFALDLGKPRLALVRHVRVTFAELLERGLPVGKAKVAVLIVEKYGIALADAMALIRQYGLGAAKRALMAADTFAEFMLQLVGYKKDMPSGGGGGASEGEPVSYPEGTAVPLSIALADPFTGEPVTDALVSYTVSRALPAGISERAGRSGRGAATAGRAGWRRRRRR